LAETKIYVKYANVDCQILKSFLC